MDNFKLATQAKLRFPTTKGLLSTEQLWDLPIEDLDNLVISLDEKYKDSSKKSFVFKKTPKDKMIKLQFDVALDILNTKLEDSYAAQEALDIKRHNEKIFNIIAEKQEENLKSQSISELRSQLR